MRCAKCFRTSRRSTRAPRLIFGSRFRRSKTWKFSSGLGNPSWQKGKQPMAKKAVKKRKGPSLADKVRPRKKKGAKALDPKADFDQPVKKPRKQGRLKGMEDNAIQDL